MIATINTIHRRTHVQAYDLLHRMAANGEIEGFLLPYMGQIDERLPYCPPDLVPRDRTFNYSTNFSPMSDENIRVLSQRGEQLTRLLLYRSEAHTSELPSLMLILFAVFCLKKKKK